MTERPDAVRCTKLTRYGRGHNGVTPSPGRSECQYMSWPPVTFNVAPVT